MLKRRGNMPLKGLAIFLILFFMSIPSRAEEYAIGPEDVLEITVWQQEKLSKTVTVSKEGGFDYPLLGEIEASGLAPKQLSELIARELRKSYIKNPRVTVLVKEYNSQKVYILGEVASPGPYVIGGNVTVLEAIKMVGGFTPIADPARIKIVRQRSKNPPRGDQDKGQGRRRQKEKKEIIRVNVNKLMKGDKSQDVVLQAGDVIVVPESFF